MYDALSGTLAGWQRRAVLICCVAIAFSVSGSAFAQNEPAIINSPNGIGLRLSQCWVPPAPERPQMLDVTVRLSFSSAGAVIGEPRVSYIRATEQAGLREKIKASVLAAIKACTPLRFTPSLGAAIAGRIIAIRLRRVPVSGKTQLI